MIEEKTGGEVLAIAHNGNLSNGRMFPIIESFTGKTIDRDYAENRVRWEPLYEATQIKGDGETHPFLSPNDEFANFERWDKGNLDLSELKKPEMLEFEYARSALKNGLKLEAELGVNPYKFGMVGSTDAHTGLAAVEEDNFFGKTSSSEPSAEPRHASLRQDRDKAVIMGWEQTASGYAAVWATENTREAIFDAMKRRETYATTGPRMVVRFFGGWDFEPSDANNRMPAQSRLHQGRADGRRPEQRARRQGADLPRRRAQGSDRREPRPHPDHQGLARRKDGRRRRRSTTWPCPAAARSAPTAAARRSATPWTWRTRPGPTPSARPS